MRAQESRLHPLCVGLVLTFLLGWGRRDAQAWGDEGHRLVNRVATARLPTDAPPFLAAAAERLEFLGPEPDRWRDGREVFSALRAGTGPDHFIDIDAPAAFAALPDDRFRYAAWLRAQGKEPSATGFLPYAMLETYQKTQVLLRKWRETQDEGERAQCAALAVYYAGLLGHYVADGASPLHTTVHYNGWSSGLNPDGYTREPLHARFESEYVKERVQEGDVLPLVKQGRRLPDPFADVLAFLLESHGLVRELYRLEKTARWDAGNTSEESKRFVAGRLGAGAQMLVDLWTTAWIESARGARPAR
jgi:hypothetical protein